MYYHPMCTVLQKMKQVDGCEFLGQSEDNHDENEDYAYNDKVYYIEQNQLYNISWY